MEITTLKEIEKWAIAQQGFLELSDLKVLLNENSEVTFYRKIKSLIQNGIIIKIKRGFYATPDIKLENLVNKLIPTSYITGATVLAKVSMIGTSPIKKIHAIKTGRPRKLKTSVGIIEYMTLAPKLFCGYILKEGNFYATPEKAFLDVCYLYYKGKRFSFDPEQDISLEQLKLTEIRKFLKLYDIRFITFYKKIWGKYV